MFFKIIFDISTYLCIIWNKNIFTNLFCLPLPITFIFCLLHMSKTLIKFIGVSQHRHVLCSFAFFPIWPPWPTSGACLSDLLALSKAMGLPKNCKLHMSGVFMLYNTAHTWMSSVTVWGFRNITHTWTSSVEFYNTAHSCTSSFLYEQCFASNGIVYSFQVETPHNWYSWQF